MRDYSREFDNEPTRTHAAFTMAVASKNTQTHCSMLQYATAPHFPLLFHWFLPLWNIHHICHVTPHKSHASAPPKLCMVQDYILAIDNTNFMQSCVLLRGTDWKTNNNVQTPPGIHHVSLIWRDALWDANWQQCDRYWSWCKVFITECTHTADSIFSQKTPLISNFSHNKQAGNVVFRLVIWNGYPLSVCLSQRFLSFFSSRPRWEMYCPRPTQIKKK